MTMLAVALDGSDDSSSILQTVGPLARAWKSPVSLVSVVATSDLQPARKSVLERLAAGLSAQGLAATFQVRVGAPAEELLAFTRETRPALLAVATHGRRGLDRLRLGSTAEEVLRRAEVPLLIARPDTATLRGSMLLTALDGSPEAESILPDVVGISRATGWPVDLARATLPAVTAAGLGEFPMYFPKEDPQPYLEGVCKRLAVEGVKARPVALAGRASTEVLRYAAEAGAGMICLTTHGRTGLRRVLLGSIAEEILRGAACPVLVRRNAG